jgi:hypothetical protein
VHASRQIDPASLRQPGGDIDLARLAAARPALGHAVVTADHGRLRVTRFGGDSVLSDVAAHVSFRPDYHQLYDGAGTTTQFGKANLSANFPYATRIWA